MKELESILKIVEEGLRTLAKGVTAIADKLDEFAEPPEKAKPKRKTARKAPAGRAKNEKPRKSTPKGKKRTAADTVLSAIGRSRKGVDTAALMQKTGFDRKKIQNTVFKLKKEGKIKNASKGMYIKT